MPSRVPQDGGRVRIGDINEHCERATIRKATQDWARAIGDKNAAAMSRFFTEDVVTFDLAPPLKHTTARCWKAGSRLGTGRSATS